MAEHTTGYGIRAALRADPYRYLMSERPHDVAQTDNHLTLAGNPCISVRNGYSGYRNLASGETGDAVELLTSYLGCDPREAVASLCKFAAGLEPPPAVADLLRPENVLSDFPYSPPLPFAGTYMALFDHLGGALGIPPHVVQRLIDMGVLYQEGAGSHDNAVFIDPARTYFEVLGTHAAAPSRRIEPCCPSAFWWFKPGSLDDIPTMAYVTESAVDAVSLYLLLSVDRTSGAERFLFCSVGGADSQDRIDAIKAGMAAGGCRTVIAAGRGTDGDLCRQRNQDCQHLLPNLNSWNEDLLDYERRNCGGRAAAWLGRPPAR